MPIHLSDEEILLKGKTQESYEILLRRYLKNYKLIIHEVALSLNQRNYDLDDYFYDFYVSFHKAFINYNSDKGLFYTFFKTIFKRKVTNKMMSQIRSHDALDHAISLDQEFEEGVRLIDLVENENADNPVSGYRINNAKLVLREATAAGPKSKSSLRYKALMMRADGLTYKEIANKLMLNISKVRRLVDTNSDLRLKDIKLDLK